MKKHHFVDQLKNPGGDPIFIDQAIKKFDLFIINLN